jgi:hypothetical protein
MAVTVLFTGNCLISSLMMQALFDVTVPFCELHLLRTPLDGEGQASLHLRQRGEPVPGI